MKTIANLEYDGSEYTVVFCEDCNLLQCTEYHHDISPEYVCLKSSDIDESRIWCQGHHKDNAYRHWDKNLRELKPEIYRSLRLLDIGCGTGGFLEHVKSSGFELYGFDASKAQPEYARKFFPNVRYARSCSEYLVERGDRKLLFDVITLWDVLEHIRNPLYYLCEIRSVIQPGGLVYISTPNGLAKLWKQNLYKLLSIDIDLCGEFMPWEHVFYYSPRSLEYLLEKSGFGMLKLGTVPCYRRPLSKFEITRRALFFGMKMFPSKAFQIYAWAST